MAADDRVSDDSGAVADVYAGDAGQCLTEPAATLFRFVIELDPAPDAFARVAMIFNVANMAPQTVTFQRDAADMATMSISIALRGEVQADMIRRKVAQLTCTVSVSLTGSP